MRSQNPVRRAGAIGLGAVAIGALLSTMAASAAPADDPGSRDLRATLARGPLTDLSQDADPTDGGYGVAIIARGDAGSLAKINLAGLDPAMAGHTLGVHVHTGPCVAGNGDAAGPHYNHDKATGREPVRISPETEVWLDVTVDAEGRGQAWTRVPFTVPAAGDGVGSIVVHEHPTDHAGMAGGRLACLPLT